MLNLTTYVDATKRYALEHAPWLLRHVGSATAKGLTLVISRHLIAVVDRQRKRQIRLSRANSVYVRDMVSYFDYYFGSVEPYRARDQGETYDVVDFSSPRYHDIAGFSDFPIYCPSLAEPFVTCQQYLDFARLSPGQVVLDLGSYSGLTSTAFSKAVGEHGRIVAVEPDPSNLAACRKNFALHLRTNRLDNIALLPLAISGSAGSLSFSSEGSMGSAVVSVVGGYRGTVIEVPCVTIAEVAEREKLPRVDFIKMDIEGSEVPALRAIGPFLQAHRPRLIVEPHKVDGELNDRAIIECLTASRYRCTTIEQRGISVPLVTAEPLTP